MNHRQVLAFLTCVSIGIAFGFFMNWLAFGRIEHGGDLAGGVGVSTVIMALVSVPIMDSLSTKR